MKQKKHEDKKSKDLGDPRGSRELTDIRGGTQKDKTEKGDIHRNNKRKK